MFKKLALAALLAILAVPALGQVLSPVGPGPLGGCAPNCALTNTANIFTAAPQKILMATTTGPDFEVGLTGDTVSRVALGLNTTNVARVSFGAGGASARDLFIERAGAATVRWGAPDAAAPVAQIDVVQSVVTGTTDTAGALRKFLDSGGTGTGQSGGFEWDLHPAGSTASTPNAAAAAMSLNVPAASMPGLLLSISSFSGGTGTTTFPKLFIQPTGATAATTWSTSGTQIGVNTATGFAGNFLDFHVNGGSSLFSVAASGALSVVGFSAAGGRITLSGSRTAAAWTTSGTAITQAAGTFTDTTSSGTVAAEYINAFLAPTLAFSSATVVTDPYGSYFVAPICTGGASGNKCTATNGPWALGADSLKVTGANVNFSGITTGTNADFLCLSATGAVLIQASACTISSLRFKENVEPFTDSALREIDLLQVFSYNLKKTKPANRDSNTTRTQIGLTAENIAATDPRCAIYESGMKTPKSYRQECIIALLVKGEQELQAENVRLRAANDNSFRAINARLEKLEHPRIRQARN